MRIAIVNITRGDFSGGYRKYLEHIVKEIRVLPNVTRAHVMLPAAAASLANTVGDDVSLWPPAPFGAVPVNWIRSQAHKMRADVVFIPTARYIAFRDQPTVVMVRNMEPLVGGIDNGIRDRALNALRRRAAYWACQRADRVIAVSDFVASFVADSWAVPPERLGVVHHGIEPALAGVRAAALRELGDAPFVFTAGSLRPARGLSDLINAWPLVVQSHPGIRLVIGGTAARRSLITHVRDQLARTGTSDSVLLAGHLSPQEMAWAYQHCSAFVMTSRVEACPNIVLEAMSYASLSVSTDSRPMPEFFREAALYYAAGDCEMLARRIAEALSLPAEEARRYRAAAALRSKSFSWRKCAQLTVAELGLALAAHSTEGTER